MPDRPLDPDHPHFQQLSDWQARARREADRHSTHATKRAVDAVQMTEPERMAAHALWQLCKDEILHICRAAYQKSQRAPDAPPLAEADVVQSAWELFLRCLVRYDPEKGSLTTYLRHALRNRVTGWLRSKSETRIQEEDETPRRRQAAEPAPSELVLRDILKSMIRQGRLPTGAEGAYEELVGEPVSE